MGGKEFMRARVLTKENCPDLDIWVRALKRQAEEAKEDEI